MTPDANAAVQKLAVAQFHLDSARRLLADAVTLCPEGDISNMCHSSIDVADQNLRLLRQKYQQLNTPRP